MDADHLDIYGDADHLVESFRQFAAQLKPGGELIKQELLKLDGGMTYSVQKQADVMAGNIRVQDGCFVFDYTDKEVQLKDLQLYLPGLHNVSNMTAAIKAVLLAGVNAEKIAAAVASFKGVKRRFEYIVRTPEHIFIDDYAHHPEELRACLSAVKMLYPNKRLTAMFQPHLYTRTRDFADGFAEVLGMADDLILLDIYPARELPIEGVTSEMILDRVDLAEKQKCGKEEALEYIRNEKPGLILTLGAGDIDTLVKPIKTILEHA
jgi:UDP-N-acetylmuramate--alanine ligase